MAEEKKPVPAVKPCLHCEAPLCNDHLGVQSKPPEHVLSDPTTALEARICSVHKKILEYYCTEDSACICVSCRLDGDHRGHQVELLKEMAEEEKKEKLRNGLENLTSKIEETEKRVQCLHEFKEQGPETTAGGSKRVTVLFRDITKHMKNQLLNRQEERVSLSVSDQIQQLEMKKYRLSRNICHIEELCNVTDPPGKEQGDRKINPVGLGKALPSETTQTDLADIVARMKKGMCAREASNLLLDIDTAGNNVALRSDLKSAFWTVVEQGHPKTKKRFQDPQILSINSFLTGKHFWEVETSRSGNWRVGLCYPSIVRKGFGSYIGCNNKSWSLCKWNNQYSVMHNCKEIQLSQRLSSQRLGIYLDYEAGQLSFYELCDPIRHLHTFTATFKEPLHAAFRIWLDALGTAWILIRS